MNQTGDFLKKQQEYSNKINASMAFNGFDETLKAAFENTKKDYFAQGVIATGYYQEWLDEMNLIINKQVRIVALLPDELGSIFRVRMEAFIRTMPIVLESIFALSQDIINNQR